MRNKALDLGAGCHIAGGALYVLPGVRNFCSNPSLSNPEDGLAQNWNIYNENDRHAVSLSNAEDGIQQLTVTASHKARRAYFYIYAITNMAVFGLKAKNRVCISMEAKAEMVDQKESAPSFEVACIAGYCSGGDLTKLTEDDMAGSSTGWRRITHINARIKNDSTRIGINIRVIVPGNYSGSGLRISFRRPQIERSLFLNVTDFTENNYAMTSPGALASDPNCYVGIAGDVIRPHSGPAQIFGQTPIRAIPNNDRSPSAAIRRNNNGLRLDTGKDWALFLTFYPLTDLAEWCFDAKNAACQWQILNISSHDNRLGPDGADYDEWIASIFLNQGNPQLRIHEVAGGVAQRWFTGIDIDKEMMRANALCRLVYQVTDMEATVQWRWGEQTGSYVKPDPAVDMGILNKVALGAVHKEHAISTRHTYACCKFTHLAIEQASIGGAEAQQYLVDGLRPFKEDKSLAVFDGDSHVLVR